MILAYDYNKCFWLINPSLTEEQFLSLSGVESGYSRNMFSRIYKTINSELIDLEIEYEKYYSFEYETLTDFLYKKFNVKNKDIKELLKQKAKYPYCRIYRKDDYSYGDYNIPRFITSETMYKRISKVLKLKL